jgi:hypothetical protein
MGMLSFTDNLDRMLSSVDDLRETRRPSQRGLRPIRNMRQARIFRLIILIRQAKSS